MKNASKRKRHLPRPSVHMAIVRTDTGIAIVKWEGDAKLTSFSPAADDKSGPSVTQPGLPPPLLPGERSR